MDRVIRFDSGATRVGYTSWHIHSLVHSSGARFQSLDELLLLFVHRFIFLGKPIGQTTKNAWSTYCCLLYPVLDSDRAQGWHPQEDTFHTRGGIRLWTASFGNLQEK